MGTDSPKWRRWTKYKSAGLACGTQEAYADKATLLDVEMYDYYFIHLVNHCKLCAPLSFSYLMR